MSSEDWGFDPYADIMEAFGASPTPRLACRWCKHAVADHNRSVGCEACTCMATPGEATPRTSIELDVRPFAHNHIVVGYARRRPKTAPRKDADMKTAAELQRELSILEANEASLAARRADLEAALALRATLPSEPAEDAVIKFRVQFDANGIVYTFIATRTRRNSSAQWYTTGSNTKHKGPHSWDDLLSLMQEDHGVKTGAAKLEFFLFDESGKWVR